ncbi:MAG: alpha/beta fold hydrolase [Dehalococcoidia bacterium]
MEPKSKFIEANGINHHYLDWGSPEKPPVVMTHGIGLCAHIWNHAARDLTRDYHVMSLDLRGHGDTDKPGVGYSFRQLGEDVAAVIQALDLDRPYGVGHSAGGMSLMIADHIREGSVGKVVLVDTRVGNSPMMLLDPKQRRQRMERTQQKRSVWESREVMYEAYRQRRVFRTWSDEVFGHYIEGATRLLEDGQVEIKCPNEAEATFYQARRELDTSLYVKGLQGRYRLLVGNYEDAQTEQDEAVKRLRRESRNFSFKALAKGSHFVPMEYPDLVLEEIRAFLDEDR